MHCKDKVFVLYKGQLAKCPPAITVSLALSRLSHQVEVITSLVDPATKQYLISHGVDVHEVDPKIRSNNPFSKAINWINFNRRTWKILSLPDSTAHLWVGSGDTALALGRRLLKERFVIQVHELYDKHPRYLKALAAYARAAVKVVVPEFSRASILRSWWALSETPVVLPNKPFDHPRKREVAITHSATKEIIKQIPKGKMILYQGFVSAERDLSYIARALHTLKDDYVLVLMGEDVSGSVAKLKRLYNKIVHIPFITPPFHLEVTSHAHISIASYDHSCLNNVFCAPNKIWEYTGFGIPIICADLPSLRTTVENAGAGLCADIANVDSIIAAIRRIEERYDEFSNSASDMFDSVDMSAIIADAIGDTSRCIKMLPPLD